MLVELSEFFWLACEGLIEALSVDSLLVALGTGIRLRGLQEVEPDHDIFLVRDDRNIPIALFVVLRLLNRLHDSDRIEAITIAI